MAVSDRCANATSVTRNESTGLLGHDSNFKSDDTFDLIIVLINIFTYLLTIQKKTPFHLFKRYLKTSFEAEKHIAIVNMSHDKFVIDWHFDKDLIWLVVHLSVNLCWSR